MVNPLLLLRRIQTAQNVSKTTRAMQMISASKLKRAQGAALSSRPYVDKLSSITRNLTTRLDKQALPLYMKETDSVKKTLYLVISSDKGLCGGLVTNLAREILHKDTDKTVFITVGKKIEGIVSHLGMNLIASFPFGTTLPSFNMVYPIVKLIDEQFLSGKVEKVEILSTRFTNVFFQKPHMTRLLPIRPHEATEEQTKKFVNRFQLFEPDRESILPDLLNRYIEMIVYQEILESYLSEQAARMISMQNATNSAKDMIEDLKLEYNKSRQAKITNEILDISSAGITA